MSHPPQIAVVGEHLPGVLGLTFAPGKHDSGAVTGAWARDLGADLDAIVAWGARTLVTLIEPHEFDLLAIPRLGDEARRRGLDWLHLPIRDISTLGRAFEATWPSHSVNLRRRPARTSSCTAAAGRGAPA